MTQEIRNLNIVRGEHELPYLQVGDIRLETEEAPNKSFGYKFNYGAMYKLLTDEQETCQVAIPCPCVSTF